MILPLVQPGDLVAEMVFKRFGRREILKGVFFRANPGRITALLGVNGCGKSTLLRMISGVLRADAGQFIYAGRPCDAPSLARLARQGLAYLPQDPMLLPQLTIGAQLRSFNRDTTQIQTMVKGLGIPFVLERKPVTLSGGERRRCDLAAVLLRRPRFLLVDEPFTGVAPIDVECISDALRACAAAGATVVITDHTIESTLAITDDVWFLDAGACRYTGDRDRAIRDVELRHHYLGRRAMPRPAHPAA